MAAPTGRTQADTISVEELLNAVSLGRIRIPRFQRRFKWDQQDVLKLFDSIYKGFPVGTLLFWEREAPAEDVEFGPVVVKAPAERDAHWVLDGQQRITALAGVLLNDQSEQKPGPKFQVAFDLREGVFVPSAGSDGTARDLVPLGALRDFGRVLKWFQETGADLQHQHTLRQLLTTILGYKLTRYVIQDADETAAREVFNRLNHTGKALTAVEVFTAAQAPGSSMDVQGLAQRLGDEGFGAVDQETLLNCILVAEGHDIATDKKGAALQAAKEDAFERVRPAVERAAQFVLDAGCHSVGLLPYEAHLMALVRFFHRHSKPHPRNLILLRRWLWRSMLGAGFGGDIRTPARFITAHVGDDEDAAIQKLLEKVGRERVEVTFAKRYDPRSAHCKVALMALVAAKPQDPAPGKARMAGVLQKDWGSLPRLVDPSDIRRELDNVSIRVLWGPAEHETWLDWASEKKPELPQAVLDSHLIPAEAWQALKDARAGDAATLRSNFVLKAIQRYADVRCEWEQEDRPPLRVDAGEPDGDEDEPGHRSPA